VAHAFKRHEKAGKGLENMTANLGGNHEGKSETERIHNNSSIRKRNLGFLLLEYPFIGIPSTLCEISCTSLLSENREFIAVVNSINPL